VTPLIDLALPVARRLNPELAHGLALRALSLVPMPSPAADDPRLAVTALGLHFANPLGLAAGFDKDAAVPDAALKLGFGFVEVGTLTPQPQSGNPAPRLFRLDADHGLINRLGFNNCGFAAARQRLLARAHRSGIVGVNIGANRDTADRIGDYVSGVEAFAAIASYLVINVSSPNTPGLRDLQAHAALDELLVRAVEARDRAVGDGRKTPLLVKIAPDLALPQLDAIIAVARVRKIDGMIVSNTTLARPASLSSPAAGEEGGLSGRPLFALSTRMLAETYVRVEGAFPLIGVGGIDSAEAAWAKIRAGASLLQLYTGLVHRGFGLVGEIKTGLLECLWGARTLLKDAVGADANSTIASSNP
jgi:dihydroorotate dehydrogenase